MTERDQYVYLMLGTDDEKKRPSVVAGAVNDTIDRLYKELDEHLNRMQKT